MLGRLARYVTVNVSSPNTPGLRGLQNRDELSRLLGTLTDARKKKPDLIPILLKIAPDLDGFALDEIAAVVLASGIEGLIVSNTTVGRGCQTLLRHCGRHAQRHRGLHFAK